MDPNSQPQSPSALLLNHWRTRKRLAEGFGALDLTLLQATLLSQLCQHKNPSQLASMLAVTRESISQLLRQLQAKGLVARDKFPDDARQVVVTLTPAGSEVYEQISEVVAQAPEVLSRNSTDETS